MQSPRVTVTVPSYNHALFVGDTISSILRQSCQDFELLIIDDGSRDDSVARIQASVAGFPGRAVQIVARQNRGLCRTLNEALAQARGDYFAYLGSDDLWEPQKLERQLQKMAETPAAAACYSDCFVIDDQGRRLDRLGRQYRYRGGHIFRDLVMARFHPPSPTNLFVTDKLKAVGGFNEELPIEDFNLWVRLTRRYPVAYLPEPLASFRVHGTNTSANNPHKMRQTFEATIEMAFQLAPELLPSRRRLQARMCALAAAEAYGAGDRVRARAEVRAALRLHPLEWTAWGIGARSLLGGRAVDRLRRFVRSARAARLRRAAP